MNELYPVGRFHDFEKIIGHTFNNITLLENALTHSSYFNENRFAEGILPSNERLEFLGDSVLSIVVSDYIYRNYSSYNEGDLTKIRAAVVCENTLALLAKEIDLGSFLMFGKGEAMNNGRERKSILSDAFEAVIASVYLDGGLEKARSFILPLIVDEINKAMKKGTDDYKSRLQRISQEMPEEHLEYVLIAEEGPPHDRTFTVEVRLNSNVLGTGKGKRKSDAEQMAAKEALRLFPTDENA